MREGDVSRRLRHRRKAGVFNDKTLKRLVAEGRASGEPVDGEAALMRLRAKYSAMADGESR